MLSKSCATRAAAAVGVVPASRKVSRQPIAATTIRLVTTYAAAVRECRDRRCGARSGGSEREDCKRPSLCRLAAALGALAEGEAGAIRVDRVGGANYNPEALSERSRPPTVRQCRDW